MLQDVPSAALSPSSCDAEILAFEAYLEQNMVSYDGVINIVPENTLFGLKLNNTPPIEGLRQHFYNYSMDD